MFLRCGVCDAFVTIYQGYMNNAWQISKQCDNWRTNSFAKFLRSQRIGGPWLWGFLSFYARISSTFRMQTGLSLCLLIHYHLMVFYFQPEQRCLQNYDCLRQRLCGCWWICLMYISDPCTNNESTPYVHVNSPHCWCLFNDPMDVVSRFVH